MVSAELPSEQDLQKSAIKNQHPPSSHLLFLLLERYLRISGLSLHLFRTGTQSVSGHFLHVHRLVT